MKKVMAITALAALIAAGCASHENQGGTSSTSSSSWGYNENTSDMTPPDTKASNKELRTDQSLTNNPHSQMENQSITNNVGGATTPDGSDTDSSSSGSNNSNDNNDNTPQQ